MAPIATKRRRAEDEARPKKKIRKIRKGKAYHSSSEDEDDEPTTAGAQRASDAPQLRPKYSMKSNSPPTRSITATKTQVSKPKSILKRPNAAPERTQRSGKDSSSSSEADLDELEKNTALNALKADDSDSDADMDVDDEPDLDSASADHEEEESLPSESEASVASSQAARAKKKRNDPAAFATSISKILDTKLSTAKRQDPVLSRSKSAAEANKTLADEKLEQKARAQIRAEKRLAAEKGRVRDVLGLETPDVDTGAIVEEEKRLKKTAQRGVVKLFNAVRAAQVKAEEAMKQARSEGVVGMQKREEQVNEMSKQGFLDLLSSGGRQSAAVPS